MSSNRMSPLSCGSWSLLFTRAIAVYRTKDREYRHCDAMPRCDAQMPSTRVLSAIPVPNQGDRFLGGLALIMRSRGMSGALCSQTSTCIGACLSESCLPSIETKVKRVWCYLRDIPFSHDIFSHSHNASRCDVKSQCKIYVYIVNI